MRSQPGFLSWRRNRRIVSATVKGDQVDVQLDDGAGVGAGVYDHVLLATGYKVDLARLRILPPELLRRIACVDGAPSLAEGFESTVPGLHFVGASSVASFGPLMRFVAGTGYAARAVSQRIARGVSAAPVARTQAPAALAEVL